MCSTKTNTTRCRRGRRRRSTGKVSAPWAEFEHAGIAKIKAEAGQEVYSLTPAQVEEWKKAARPLEQKWADNVRKAGGNADAIMKELKDQLAKYKASF